MKIVRLIKHYIDLEKWVNPSEADTKHTVNSLSWKLTPPLHIADRLKSNPEYYLKQLYQTILLKTKSAYINLPISYSTKKYRKNNLEKYFPRSLSLNGALKVNTKTFDAKQKYREWTDGGHKIHCTNSDTEALHDIWLLLGRSPNEFVARKNWSRYING